MTAIKEADMPVGATENDVRQFLNEIRQFPRLSAQEERELAQRCAVGDQEAIRQMVNSNLRLVVSIAREYAGRGVPLLDLIQEGSIGLLSAARKFDVSLDYRFSTYATKWIRQGVTRCLMNHGGLIRVPLHTAERMKRLDQAYRSFQQETGREPDEKELAEASGFTPERVRQLRRLTPEVSSLDIPVGEEENTSLQSVLKDVNALQPYETLVRRELEGTMDKLLSTLTERQRQILCLHFGMTDGTCYSLEEISKKLGVSKERVRQIERQAMDRLQKNGSAFGLEDFLND